MRTVQNTGLADIEHAPTLHRMQRLAWLAVALFAVTGVLLAINRLAERHLLADAERSAVSWAQHIARAVPRVDRVFGGELPTLSAQVQLIGLRGTAGLFRFKFFDTQGRLLLVSDDVDNRPAPQPGQVPAAVLSGGSQVTMKHGDGQTNPLTYSEAFVPVMLGGRMLGVIEVYLDQTDSAALTEASFQKAALMASAALAVALGLTGWLWRRRALQGARTEEQLRYLAQHDVLTGAINLVSFRQQLTQACTAHVPGGAGLAVLHIDIDRFKEVNDVHGHAAGDQLLRQMAGRLGEVLRGTDVLARISGDRFAVLQSGVAASQDVSALAQRILAAMAPPFSLIHGTSGTPVTVSASVGAAILGVHGHDAQTLSQHAELALLRAKSNGRCAYSFYDAAFDQALHKRRELAHDLQQALAHGSLRLHFQPLWDNDGHTLVGYEALARWPHPTRGFVSPVDFIPLAEETGLIDALGRWVLHTACAEAATWPDGLSVAVNLSPAQFRADRDIVEEVVAALQASGLPAQRLELEITESLLMGHTEKVLASLGALHALGVRIAMDDFGTGYSSLAYLWRFPFDKVKIDRAFTQGLGSDAKVDVIVRSIVSLAHSLAIRVNAEGVETELQCQALRQHGCDELQGFLLGRPMPPERLAHLSMKTPAEPVQA